MRKLKDAEIIFVVYTLLCVLLGGLALHYRSAVQYGRSDFLSFTNRNIEFTADFHGLRYHGFSNNLIDAHVLYFGAFEKPTLYWLRDTAAALGGDDLVFVDIGANTGQHSLFMSQHAGQVHAFDPYPPVIARFREAVESNAVSNIRIHPVGLGSTNEVLEFFEPPTDNQGTGSFVRSFEDRSPAVTRLQIVNGDEYFEGKGITNVGLLKIDVEGYERDVLAGLSRTFDRDRPIGILELTVGSGEEQLFKSRNELLAAFPQDYEFALLAESSFSDLSTGDYEVELFTDLKPSFEMATQYMVIAYPTEQSHAVPLGKNRPAP